MYCWLRYSVLYTHPRELTTTERTSSTSSFFRCSCVCWLVFCTEIHYFVVVPTVQLCCYFVVLFSVIYIVFTRMLCFVSNNLFDINGLAACLCCCVHISFTWNSMLLHITLKEGLLTLPMFTIPKGSFKEYGFNKPCSFEIWLFLRLSFCLPSSDPIFKPITSPNSHS